LDSIWSLILAFLFPFLLILDIIALPLLVSFIILGIIILRYRIRGRKRHFTLEKAFIIVFVISLFTVKSLGWILHRLNLHKPFVTYTERRGFVNPQKCIFH